MRFPLALVAIALPALTFLVACRDSAAPRTSTPDRPDQLIGGTIVPQSHEFPVGRADEIRRIFDEHVVSYPVAVMSKDGVQTQFVNPRPVFIGDRRFVVGLPPAQHAALDRLIADLGKAPATAGGTFELTFWLVEAVAAAETQVPPDLSEVGPMLEKLAALGKRHYKSLDRIAGRSRDGNETKLSGRIIQAEHQLIAGPEGIDLELTLALKGAWSDRPADAPTFETTLHLPLDQPIVIGDSVGVGASQGAANLLLYVVRARRVD